MFVEYCIGWLCVVCVLLPMIGVINFMSNWRLYIQIWNMSEPDTDSQKEELQQLYKVTYTSVSFKVQFFTSVSPCVQADASEWEV